MNEKEGLVENILVLAEKLFRKLLPTVPRELLEMDITMPQMKILLLLFLNGHLRMSDIAAQLEVTLPTATSLVDRLVEKDYVTRDSLPVDRRVVLCRLSEEGQKTVGRIWESARERSKELLETMDVNRLTGFAEILGTMLESAEAKGGRIVSKEKAGRG